MMDEDLVQAIDLAVRRARSNRSRLIRDAVQRHLAYLQQQQQEEAHRQGYERHPQTVEELEAWERIQAWPKD